ncbi:cytochrome o ubiquinol oxidase subunit IV [Altererythrobacter sp. CC-YST694]|uniref:cytochrome o ubiquinol oxidase subunit IV n=1 Tax=Altererythrobacter sp. CC-YST694 TaxID=2755038 RepID=UPI001D02FF7A|nr:cytochrome o ubiquinol oxidase subunit IV [Altererythrobacter sp. CC-YST694]MCB5426451.1 cytochrome o ubiquinol oxidase subunit IV [Altererythrobacter sp. CC-YST694]
MSAAHEQGAGHGHGHDHGHDHGGEAHGTMRDYVWGFVLSVILTAIPFWLVMAGPIADKSVTGLIITAFAAIQIVVHMIFFLHMNARAEGGWNMLALIFTIVIVVIVLTGSLWVMYHLNANMMPQSHQMDSLP